VPDNTRTDDEVESIIICVVGLVALLFHQFIASRPTVIMFHGNGGNHGHRLPLAKIFFLKMRCNVLMLSYRGCVSIICL
jgi:hypothetical protein